MIDSQNTMRDPAWLQEIDASLAVCSQIVLSGNVSDLVIATGDDDAAIVFDDPIHALWNRLKASGYEFLLVCDRTAGLRVHTGEGDDRAELQAAAETALGRLAQTGEAISHERLAEVMTAVTTSAEHRCALTVERSGRLTIPGSPLSEAEHRFFCAAEYLVRTATAPRRLIHGRRLFNPIVWIAESERLLPDWLLTSGERLRVISIPAPVQDDRIRMAEELAGSFSDVDGLDDSEASKLIQRFAGHTHGMSLRDMESVMRMSKDRGLGLRDVEEVVRGYRVGILDNPWKQSSLRERVSAEIDALDRPASDRPAGTITRRVIGQDDAVRRALDILARSVTGLTGAHRGPFASGPRGVLFFAGPTGVGKTELAKALSELVFGSQAYTRFDMSEFADGNTAARLIGAPPGYVGFDAGGELTNAMRERPFSVVLFDEIEKANRVVFDKFLQILEDGRLTDGRGGTVEFSEAIIVFTSNLGVIRRDAEPTDQLSRVVVTREQWEQDPESATAEIRKVIDDFFVRELGRPELRNRLGNNVVVFGYIDHATGERILSLLLENVVERLQREHGLRLELSPAARAALAEMALSDLSNGGRGIGAMVEDALVNPLARQMIRRAPNPDQPLTITEIRAVGASYQLTVA